MIGEKGKWQNVVMNWGLFGPLGLRFLEVLGKIFLRDEVIMVTPLFDSFKCREEIILHEYDQANKNIKDSMLAQT